MKESESIRLLTKAIPFRLSLIEQSKSKDEAVAGVEAIRDAISKICDMEGITPPAAQSTETTTP